MSPDLTSLTLVARQAMDLAEEHVRTHRPGLVIPKGDRDMATDVDLAIERMIREFLAETTPTIALSDAIVAVGDYGTDPDAAARNRAALALHAYLAPRVQRVRMLGSAAVDLAWVADGTLDASITLGNRAWDMAAGAVIAHQAGAAVFDADGTPHSTRSHFTIAAAPALRNAVLTAVQAATRPDAITGHRQHGAPC